MAVQDLLARMMDADGKLYERILDTPGFALAFNQLCVLARSADERVAAERERMRTCLDRLSADLGDWMEAAGRAGVTARDVEAIRRTREGAPAPTWNREPPTAPGWYWYMSRRTCEVEVVRVVDRGELGPAVTRSGREIADSLSAFEGQWCGPLEVPS